MAKRLDFLGRLDGKQRTPQGGLRTSANLTRTGIFLYQDARGETVREYRPPEEVFHADSLDTLKLAPLVVGHPSEVRTDNWRTESVGVVAENVRPNEIYVTADVLVQDGPTIERVDAGELVELSCGYEVEVDRTPGTTPEGEQYDVVQRFIRYNHVGLGPANWGRAGGNVRLHLDGVEYLRLDSSGDVVLPPYSPGMLEEKKRADALEAERDALKTENAQLRADAATLQSDLVGARALSGKLVDPAQIPAMVAARVSLETSARTILGASASFTKKDSAGVESSLSDDEVIALALEKADPSFKADGKSADYIRATFDFAVARSSREDAAHAGLQSSIVDVQKAGGTAEKSRLDEAKEKAEADAKAAAQAGPPAGALVRK